METIQTKKGWLTDYQQKQYLFLPLNGVNKQTL